MHLDPAIFNNFVYKIILVFLYALFATAVAAQYFIKKLTKLGYVTEDKYKPDKRKIPTLGGLAMFAGVIIALALSVLLLLKDDHIGGLFIFYFIITIYALYGVVDDLFAFKQRYDKIITLLVLSLPIAVLVTHDTVNIFGWSLYLGAFLPYLIAPIYVMVVANLHNVYSGFNGLSAGLGVIILVTIGIKSYLVHGLENLIFLMPILGATIAFFPKVFFPAKALEGNVGQFMMGAAIGALLIINEFEVFGIIILIPHIVNFIMDTVVLGILKIPDVKFGGIRPDGTVIAPPSVRYKSLKFLLTHHIHLNERNATLVLYLPTIVLCVLAVVFL